MVCGLLLKQPMTLALYAVRNERRSIIKLGVAERCAHREGEFALVS